MNAIEECKQIKGMCKLVLFGAGGMGREVAVLVRQINIARPTFDLLGFVVDDEYYIPGQAVNGLPVLGATDWLVEHREKVYCAICVGDAADRLRVFNKLQALGVRFATLISPDVYIDATTSVGNGCIITVRCLISPNVCIHDGVFLNSDVTLGHDTVVHRCATLYPRSQISGNCVIGEGAQLGSCTFLSKGAKIGDGAIVAPLSAVYGKVKPHTYVMGNPAHRIEL